MENTEKVLFEDDRPQWYIALGDRWVGPISASEVYERVLSQKVTWAHYVWRDGQKEWMRLCDVKTFQVAVPQQPTRRIQHEVTDNSKKILKPAAKEKAKPVVKQAKTSAARRVDSEEKGWFLYYSETQFGPFTKEEVIRFLNVGRINPRVHAWRTGLPNWTRIESLDSFKDAVADLDPLTKRSIARQRAEQRKAPRRPMIAKILLANRSDVTEAVCRDISVGGMQVLTDRIPGEVGETIKLNVSSSAMDPFVAEGVIVRLLEDSKGFSFRFDRLTDAAKRSIERYIDSRK